VGTGSPSASPHRRWLGKLFARGVQAALFPSQAPQSRLCHRASQQSGLKAGVFPLSCRRVATRHQAQRAASKEVATCVESAAAPAHPSLAAYDRHPGTATHVVRHRGRRPTRAPSRAPATWRAIEHGPPFREEPPKATTIFDRIAYAQRQSSSSCSRRLGSLLTHSDMGGISTGAVCNRREAKKADVREQDGLSLSKCSRMSAPLPSTIDEDECRARLGARRAVA